MLFKKFTALMIVVAGVALAASNAQAAETMKPFVLAWSGAGEMTALVSQTEGKLRAGGFDGPYYVECVGGGPDPQAVERELTYTRGYIRGILGSLPLTG